MKKMYVVTETTRDDRREAASRYHTVPVSAYSTNKAALEACQVFAEKASERLPKKVPCHIAKYDASLYLQGTNHRRLHGFVVHELVGAVNTRYTKGTTWATYKQFLVREVAVRRNKKRKAV